MQNMNFEPNLLYAQVQPRSPPNQYAHQTQTRPRYNVDYREICRHEKCNNAKDRRNETPALSPRKQIMESIHTNTYESTVQPPTHKRNQVFDCCGCGAGGSKICVWSSAGRTSPCSNCWQITASATQVSSKISSIFARVVGLRSSMR